MEAASLRGAHVVPIFLCSCFGKSEGILEASRLCCMIVGFVLVGVQGPDMGHTREQGIFAVAWCMTIAIEHQINATNSHGTRLVSSLDAVWL